MRQRIRVQAGSINSNREPKFMLYSSAPTDADSLVSSRSRGHGITRRSRKYWCNVCNEPCESDAALRKHYHEFHPELAIEVDQKRTHGISDTSG